MRVCQFRHSREKSGGWGWIRTTEVCDGRFTVCSLWPLGNPSTYIGIEYEIVNGAGDGTRTRNLLITNQLLCQLSYTSEWTKFGASEWSRTTDTGIFSPLLYQLSYRGVMATRKGLEPSTSSVTGWHSNQLNYRATNGIIWWAFRDSNPGPIGYEPTALTN